jgi:hypothetical protein
MMMKKNLCVTVMYRILLYGILLCGSASTAFAADFGLVLGTEGEYADNLNPDGFSLTSTASPLFSAVFTETLNLYVSGKMTFEYEEKAEPPQSYVFEPERTELNLHPASALYLGLGRQRFGDPAGLIASGLFDGAAGSLNLGLCRLSLGAYYTGLLYKETANILLTPGDRERYEKPLDSSGLEGYFASRRVLLALTAEFPDLTSRTSLSAQALAQFDLNGDTENLNTQYLELRVAAEPLDPLHLSLGGIGELLQAQDELWGSMAAFTGADWELPGTVTDMLSAEFLWTSGRNGEHIQAFTPVSGRNAGRIFDGGTGALIKAALSYRLRPLNSVSLEAGTAYFIRTDLETLGDSELDEDSDSRLLGGELYGSLLWAPDPAFRFNAGGGAFFPKWGEAYREDAPVKWKVNMGVIVSL